MQLEVGKCRNFVGNARRNHLHNSEQKLTLAQGESAFIEAQTSYILSGEQDGYAITLLP